MSESRWSTATAACCPVCGHEAGEPFFEAESVPVFCNVLWPTREAALAAPCARISLVFCRECGLIHNAAFDPALTEYSPAYENSLHFSPRFQQYAMELAKRLIERHNLNGKNVVEIGCGQGDFLALLAEYGACRCVGFDPSFDEANAEYDENVTIRREYYGVGRDAEQHAAMPADLICCRHVLEHIPNPLAFLQGVRRAADGASAGDRSEMMVFFEVPNAIFTLRDLAVWDVIYEHCSYFTPVSLGELFERAGFEPLTISEEYEGQFIVIEARIRKGEPEPDDEVKFLPDVATLCANFSSAYRSKADYWADRLETLRAENSHTALWGAGSKGVTFLNALHVTHDTVAAVVDINPRKTGRFIPGTGQEVISPEFLPLDPPDTVIVMNPVYEEEIRSMLAELCIKAQVLIA